MRVPSGNTRIHAPRAMRSLPWLSTWFTADAPALRSMAMQLASTHPQPTNGIHRISRFMTQTSGGNKIMIPKVSHVEECFMKITWLPSGRFSRPSTVKWMPHKTRAAKKTTRVITPARRKRFSKERNGHTTQYVNANTSIHRYKKALKRIDPNICMTNGPACSAWQTGKVGDARELVAHLGEQREAIASQGRVFRIDHHAVEESVDRGTQRGEARERSAVVTLGKRAIDIRNDARERFMQHLLGRFEECRDIDCAGTAHLGLLEDVRDALVGGRETRGLGNAEKLRERSEARTEVERRHGRARAHRIEHLGGDVRHAASAAAVEKIRAQALDHVVPDFGGR